MVNQHVKGGCKPPGELIVLQAINALKEALSGYVKDFVSSKEALSGYVKDFVSVERSIVDELKILKK